MGLLDTRRCCLFSFLYLLCLVLVPTHAYATNFPDWLQTTEIDSELQLEGQKVKVLHLRTIRTARQVLDFFQQQWQCDIAPSHCREAHFFPWFLLSRLVDSGIESLQIRVLESGAEGMLVTNDLDVEPHIDFPLLLPKDSRLLCDAKLPRAGGSKRVALLSNSLSLAENIHFFTKQLQEQGWQQMVEAQAAASPALFFERNDQITQIFFSQEQGTTSILIECLKKNAQGAMATMSK